jgi:hypothetical protein
MFGYELVQDGMKFEFVKKDERFLKWGEKDSKLSGYCVNSFSEAYKSASCCDSIASASEPSACDSVAKVFIVVQFLS